MRTAGPVPNPHPPAGLPTVAAQVTTRSCRLCARIRHRPARCLDELGCDSGSGSSPLRRSIHEPSSAATRRREPAAVVIGGDRRQAAAADERDAASLRLDAAARLGIVNGGDELLLARRAPAAQARPGPPPAASRSGSKRWPISCARPSRSSPQAARTTASSPRSPRLRSRVSMLPRSGSIESVGSSASSCARRRAEAVPMRMPGRSGARAAERVARILSRRVGADREPVGVRRRHVLGGVDGDVDPPFEQRLLELLHEHAAGADLAERLRAVAVARGRDRHERDLDPGPAQRGRRALGLGEREPTAAGADAKQHSGAWERCATRHTRVVSPAGCERTQWGSAAAAAGRCRTGLRHACSSSPSPNRWRTTSA